MSEEDHERRMKEIFQHEQDFRQHGIINHEQAHDDIDYLYTRVRLLMKVIEELKAEKSK